MSEYSEILAKLNDAEKAFGSFEGRITEWRDATDDKIDDMQETLYGKGGLKTGFTQHGVYFVLIGACLLALGTAFAATLF